MGQSRKEKMMDQADTLKWVLLSEDGEYNALTVKVPNKDFDLISESKQLELFFSKRIDDGLLLQLHANVKIDCLYSLIIPPSYKNSEDENSLPKWLIEQAHIPVVITDVSGRSLHKGVQLSSGNKEKLKSFLGLKKEKKDDKSALEVMFEYLPAGVLMPLSTDTDFIFLCKTSNILFSKFDKTTNVVFDVRVIEDKLCFTLLNGGYFLGQIYIEKDSINEKTIKDFGRLTQLNILTFFINDEMGLDATRVTKVKIINQDIRNTVSEFLGIPIIKNEQ